LDIIPYFAEVGYLKTNSLNKKGELEPSSLATTPRFWGINLKGCGDMIYTRSSKCYFGKWLTARKQASLNELLKEYNRVVDWCIDRFDKEVCLGLTKFNLVTANNLALCDSWLTARCKKNAFSEAYALIIGTKRSCDTLKKPYSRPNHKEGKMLLSETNAEIVFDTELEIYDLLVELKCFDSRGKGVKLAIPLKRNEHFNKWISKGKLAKSIIVTDKYVQFSFEMKTPKKTSGNIIGIDPGAKHLLTTDEGNHYGNEMWDLLQKLRRKKTHSKSWHRTKEEIKEYVDKTCKLLNYKDLKKLVLEDNSGIRHKRKLKGRLSRNMRSVLNGWIIGRIDNRIQMLCEENGVSLARVPSFNNSRTCPACGFVGKENRVSQDVFVCQACGYSGNADVVGATNALARFALGTYGSEFKTEFLFKHPSYRRDNFV